MAHLGVRRKRLEVPSTKTEQLAQILRRMGQLEAPCRRMLRETSDWDNSKCGNGTELKGSSETFRGLASNKWNLNKDNYSKDSDCDDIAPILLICIV